MQKVKFFLSLKVQLLIFCLLAFLPIIFISRYLFNQHTNSLIDQELKSKLLAITSISSEKFDIESIKKLSKPEHASTQEYKSIKNELLSLKKKLVSIKNISIIVKNNSDDAFYLVDTSEKPQDLNKDGRIFPENEGLILLGDKTNQTKISTEPGLAQGFQHVNMSDITYTDNTGTWIRAYAPIPNKNNNTKLSGVLTVDMYLNNMTAENKKFFALFQNVLIFSFITILLLLFIGLKIFLFPIKKLIKQIANIRTGDFDHKIPFSWFYGEVGTLVESVNEMSDDLKDYYYKAEAGKEQLAEKQKIIETTTKQIKSKNYQLNNTILTLNSINELVEELISIKDTSELMDTVLPSTIKLIRAKKGFILEYLPEQKEFSVLNSFNTESIQTDNKLFINDSIYLKKIIDTKNYINVMEPGKIKDEEFTTALIFPLMIEKELRGAMFIMDKQPASKVDLYTTVTISKEQLTSLKEEVHFEETDETTVRTLSKLVAAVWESIHLFEIATVDGLSKLYVRRYLEKSLEEEIKKAVRNHTTIGLITVDIDNLQKCNNNYGHFVGDQVIKQVAEQIKNKLGDADFAARYASEKLVVYMPEKDLDETNSIAEEIREAIENMEISVPIGDNLKITVSIGVSAFPNNGNTTEELIRSSEEALYIAKRDGKNRVVNSEA